MKGVRSVGQGAGSSWRVVAYGLSLAAVFWLLLAAPERACAELITKDHEHVTEELAQATHTSQELSRRMGGYDVVFRRDPLRPLVDEEGQVVSSAGLQGGLAAQGVIWSTEHPLVVVDDELFGTGDAVGPYRILQIERDGVVVKRTGEAAQFIPLDRGIESEPAAP